MQHRDLEVQSTIEQAVIRKPKTLMGALCSLIEVAGTIAVMVFVNAPVFSVSHIPSSSMESTIMTDDHIIINRLKASITEPQRGDIVVFDMSDLYPDQSYWIKRVVALPGETIDLRHGSVYIDGELLDEPYAYGMTQPLDQNISFPYEVPEGHYFFMGDNRVNSLDSRMYGALSEDCIIAIDAFSVTPINTIGPLE